MSSVFKIVLFLVFLCSSCYSVQIVDYYSNFPLLSNGSVVEINLKNYNVSDPDGESVEYMYVMEPLTLVEIRVTSVPSDAATVLVQSHSFLRPVTLSYDKTPMTPSTSVNGTNVGLIKPATALVSFYLWYGELWANTTVMVAAQAYSSQAPVPGGCNMEFPVETSPHLQLSYTESMINLSFAAAAMSTPIPACDRKPPSVDHIVYQQYNPELDFSPEMYFSALQSLMTRSRIMRSGARIVPSRPGLSALRRLFAAYPGTGSSFVVMATSLTDASVYVPAFTYACDPLMDGTTCETIPDTASKILMATILFVGICICFAGHRLFMMELFFLGFYTAELLTYILMSVTGLGVGSVPQVVGFAAAALLILSWACCSCGMPIILVILACLLLGFSVASITMYPLVDYIQVMQSDLNFWAVFGAIVLLAPILLIPTGHHANLAFNALYGAYLIVMPVDLYVGANMRYTVVNILRRATVPQFNMAYTAPPFQSKDAVLAASWFILTVCGFASQLLLNKGRPPFPAPHWSNPISGVTAVYRRIRGPRTATERTPLILPGQDGGRSRLFVFIRQS